MRGSRYKRRQKKLRRVLFVGVLACLIAAGVGLESQLGPVLRAAGKARAAGEATSAIHLAASEVLTEKGDTYSDLIQIQRSDTGQVTSVSTNAMQINRLKSELSLSVQKSLEDLNREKIKIPLGNITGSSFLIGRGPMIGFRFLPVTFVTTDFESEFTDAGINQTRHQIYLRIRAGLQIAAVGYKTPFTVDTRFLVAESVIVGAVPDAFTEVIEDSGLVGDLMDFGAVSD